MRRMLLVIFFSCLPMAGVLLGARGIALLPLYWGSILLAVKVLDSSTTRRG